MLEASNTDRGVTAFARLSSKRVFLRQTQSSEQGTEDGGSDAVCSASLPGELVFVGQRDVCVTSRLLQSFSGAGLSCDGLVYTMAATDCVICF